MAWITQLVAALSLATSTLAASNNGIFQWGNLPSPSLMPLPDSSWGNANPGGLAPNTGKTRKYNLQVARDYASPDGFNKTVMLVNDQYPGPLLEANWGDWFEITVTNNINNEGISLHWHGFTQRNTSGFDGVPGVSQCPIAPGATYTYRFQADQYGSTWYHSHYSGQYSDGLFGPIVVHGPVQPGAKYDIDLGPVMVADYSHDSYYTIAQNFIAGPPKIPVFPTVDTNLINGKGLVNCSFVQGPCSPTQALPKFNFTSGKTHLLRLIHPGSASNQKFSIEGHKMTVVAMDFTPVIPYSVDVVTLGIGQRMDILVKGTGKPTDIVPMHSEIDLPCTGLQTNNPHGLGMIYYQSANQTAVPQNITYPTWPSNNCLQDPLTKTIPTFPQALPASAATTQNINITLGFNQTGFAKIMMDGSAFMTDYNAPTLADVKNGNLNFPTERNVYNFGSNSSVRVIFTNAIVGLMHPMHLHGHNFWVLAEGFGQWDGTITRAFNPTRRDTHIMSPATPSQNSYVVLEWEQDNPGAWPLHCHIAGHLSDGLYVNVLEHPERIQNEGDLPGIVAQSCTDWSAWTSSHTVDQIDSGV